MLRLSVPARLRATCTSRCLRGDMGSGTPSAHHPQFRPRRLVMPVNLESLTSPLRDKNQLLAKHRSLQRLKKQSSRRGAITLSDVPAERTVGDAFRLMMEKCQRDRLFLPVRVQEQKAYEEARRAVSLYESALAAAETGGVWPVSSAGDGGAEEAAGGCTPELSPLSAHNCDGLSWRRELVEGSAEDGAAQRRELALRRVDHVWNLIDRTPLNSPVHGALALRGKALVEGTIAKEVYALFPRLRSKQLQQLLHESAGLLPCGRVAIRTGFAELAGVSGEIGMWRELNVLSERLRVARRMAAVHLQRIRLGAPQQRRWYWRGVLKSAASRLKMFPVHKDDIQPRMEWIRSSVFAFIAFVELVERSGEPQIDARTVIMNLFCPQLEVHSANMRLLRRMDDIAATPEGDESCGSIQREVNTTSLTTLRRTVVAERERLRSLSPDDLDVLNERAHPLNDRAERRAEQFQSSGGAHATQTLRDDLFDSHVERLRSRAPPVVLHAIQPTNAFKEAQIILRYDPYVPAALRTCPIDVDQVVRRSVEVHETNPYASLSFQQQFRQVEYTVCRLMAGSQCVGEGKGETDMHAINDAALHMLHNYYTKPPPCRETNPSAAVGRDNGVPHQPQVPPRELSRLQTDTSQHASDSADDSKKNSEDHGEIFF